jgi:hypothetical protein
MVMREMVMVVAVCLLLHDLLLLGLLLLLLLLLWLGVELLVQEARDDLGVVHDHVDGAEDFEIEIELKVLVAVLGEQGFDGLVLIDHVHHFSFFRNSVVTVHLI